MIVYPKNWRGFGCSVKIDEIDKALRRVINDIDCINLSFSGGVDSSLLLYYLLEVKGKARVFTIANNIEHPDIKYAQESVKYYEDRYKVHIDHMVFIRPHLEGDVLVRAYYRILKSYVNDIISGDCIDELCCGYYNHQDRKEETYQEYLNRVQVEHLKPLNDNSGDIAVYLPYADDRVANLFFRIPLYNKVSLSSRKMIIMQLANGKVLPRVIERKKYGFATSITKTEVCKAVA